MTCTRPCQPTSVPSSESPLLSMDQWAASSLCSAQQLAEQPCRRTGRSCLKAWPSAGKAGRARRRLTTPENPVQLTFCFRR